MMGTSPAPRVVRVKATSPEVDCMTVSRADRRSEPAVREDVVDGLTRCVGAEVAILDAQKETAVFPDVKVVLRLVVYASYAAPASTQYDMNPPVFPVEIRGCGPFK